MSGKKPADIDLLYNKEIKMRYLEQCKYKNKGEVQAKLVMCSQKIEKVMFKDLYELKPKEYSTALQLLDTFNIPEIRHIVIYINDYIKWAASENLCKPSQDVAKMVDVRAIDMHDVVKRTMIKDEHHLAEIIKTGRDTTNVPNVVIPLIMVWLGIDVKEISSILESNFSNMHSILVHNGKLIYIPSCLSIMLHDYSKQDIIYISNKQGIKSLYKSESPYFFKYTCGKNTLNRYKNKKLKLDHINAMFIKFKTSYDDNKYSYGKSSFEMSGEFYRIYKKERNNIEFSPKEYIKLINPKWQPSRILDWECMYNRYIKYMWE